MNLTLIEWIDSKFVGCDWIDKDEMKQHHCASNISAGILFQETADEMILILSIGENTDTVSQAVVIPKSCIKRIRKLGVKR